MACLLPSFLLYRKLFCFGEYLLYYTANYFLHLTPEVRTTGYLVYSNFLTTNISNTIDHFLYQKADYVGHNGKIYVFNYWDCWYARNYESWYYLVITYPEYNRKIN